VIRALVPNSMKNLILPDGTISRQLQLLLTALVSNSVPVTENATTGAPLAGAILLPDTALMPAGWQQVGTTVTLGGNTYKIITLI
jgi:hypothetical protein